MDNELIEATGFLCVVAFWWFVWPPAVLLVGGLVLLLVANMRAARERNPDRPRFLDRVTRAIAAYRSAVP